MPKTAVYVDYNDYGIWTFALVTGQGIGGPGNYDVLAKKAGEGGWEPYANVQQGTESGNWREPA